MWGYGDHSYNVGGRGRTIVIMCGGRRAIVIMWGRGP